MPLSRAIRIFLGKSKLMRSVAAVMKAGRWRHSGGTFTSFCLRDLCPQADSMQKTGPVIAAGEIVEISS